MRSAGINRHPGPRASRPASHRRREGASRPQRLQRCSPSQDARPTDVTTFSAGHGPGGVPGRAGTMAGLTGSRAEESERPATAKCRAHSTAGTQPRASAHQLRRRDEKRGGPRWSDGRSCGMGRGGGKKSNANATLHSPSAPATPRDAGAPLVSRGVAGSPSFAQPVPGGPNWAAPSERPRVSRRHGLQYRVHARLAWTGSRFRERWNALRPAV